MQRRPVLRNWAAIGTSRGIQHGWPRGVQNPFPPLYDNSWIRGIAGDAEHYNERNRWAIQFAIRAQAVARTMNANPWDQNVIDRTGDILIQNATDEIAELSADIDQGALNDEYIEELMAARSYKRRRRIGISRLQASRDIGLYIQRLLQWFQRNPRFSMP